MARKSGVLLHISSLPSDDAIGTLGRYAYQFIDYLVQAGQSIWQVLPIHPTFKDGSPFYTSSLFAGNPLLIDLNKLVAKGDLSSREHQQYLSKRKSSSQVDYSFLFTNKQGILREAFRGFKKNEVLRKLLFSQFCQKNKHWLDDYALFMALKEEYGWGRSWQNWEKTDVGKDKQLFHKYLQFVFDEQMTSLSRYAKKRAIELIGDMPMYPAYDSCDVWVNREFFQLDKEGKMIYLSSVPPDYFSKTGQLWGYPLYRWGGKTTKQKQRLFKWWFYRIKRELCFFSKIKLDHFRAFVAYGRVPAGSKDATNTKWTPGPGKSFFDYLKKRLGKLPFILEDLGYIDQAVVNLRRQIGPGMSIFVFQPYVLETVEKDTVLYTGTHDNETLRQFVERLQKEDKEHLLAYLSRSREKRINWQVIDLISASKAEWVIFPIQDIFYLGKESRMNHPGQRSNQWHWRLTYDQFARFGQEKTKRLYQISKRHCRVVKEK